MMRVLICDHHVILAESLAYLLLVRGKDVVAVTHTIDDALAVLRRHAVDVCLLGQAFDGERALDRLAELRRAAPDTRVVLVSASVDSALVAAAKATGVHGVADKRQSVAEVINVLDRVHAGGSALPVKLSSPAQDRPRPANDAQRLAAFLTPRERQVVSALVSGEDTRMLARSLGIAATTVRCHIQSVLTKMGAHSRLELATTAVRAGMVSPETGEWLIPLG
jgi:two-component system, NarL family, nitrate/nitrite response regulator NarL